MDEKKRAMSSASLGKLQAPSPWLESNTSTRRNSVRSATTPADEFPKHKQQIYSNIIVSGFDEEAQLPSKRKGSHPSPTKDETESSDGSYHDHHRPSSQTVATTTPAGEPVLVDPYDPARPRLGLKQRLHHFTWAWYTLSMSTGGLALLIASQRKTFNGLMTIGFVVYLLNLVFFTGITAALCARFWLHRGDLKRSVLHPREGFFVPTAFLSLATVITGTDRYWIPANDSRLSWAIQGSYWAYMALTLILAVAQYSHVFAAHRFALQTMMPTWILPIFPIMLSGTIASVIARTQEEVAILPVLGAGLTCQGLGLSVAMFMYAHMIGRLMESGLPNREHRPGLFMCVGPPAFTALALIGMSNSLGRSPLSTVTDAAADVTGNEAKYLALDMLVLYNMAVVAAIFLWALSLWWLGIAVVAVARAPPRYFHLGWWAAVFPNTGFTLATIAMAGEFKNEAVNWTTTAMSIIMVCIYLFVLVNHVRAVWIQDIMYPGRDEDVMEDA